MAKEIKIQATNSGEVKNREHYMELADTGEELGGELIDMLSQHGASFEGLVIETYGLSKAWAALKAVARSKGYDASELFERLTLSFAKEMEGMLDEIKKEQK